MSAGTVSQLHPDRPDLARVAGTGQLVSHLAARALQAQTMHPVTFGETNPVRDATLQTLLDLVHLFSQYHRFTCLHRVEKSAGRDRLDARPLSDFGTARRH